MSNTNPQPEVGDVQLDALAERVSEQIYARLRADLLMGDDVLLDEAEVASIMQRQPEAMATWRKIGVGPQFVRLPGSKGRLYRLGAVRHYLAEIKAGAANVKPFLDAQAVVEARYGRRAAAE